MKNSEISLLIEYLESLFQDKKIPEIPEIFNKNEELQEFISKIKAIREAAGELGMSNLSHEIKGTGYILGSLKNLQASLKNLT